TASSAVANLIALANKMQDSNEMKICARELHLADQRMRLVPLKMHCKFFPGTVLLTLLTCSSLIAIEILMSVNCVHAQGWMTTTAPNTNWFGITSSADGTTLMAAVNKYPYQSGNGGPIYISTNSGASWAVANAPVTNWISIATSVNGSRLIAAGAVPV